MKKFILIKMVICVSFLANFSMNVSAQNASLTLNDFDLKGNVKEVSETLIRYDSWKKESEVGNKKIYKFDNKGFLTYLKSDPKSYKDNDYVYETTYNYSKNYSEMTEISKTFNNKIEEKDKARNETYTLEKTSIGYLKDYKPSPSIKRNAKGELTNYTWYSPNSAYGSSFYTFEYKDGFIYETKTPLVTTRYDSKGIKIYDFVLSKPSYFYYNSDGFLFKKVYYPLTDVVYDYYEYTKDNRGNWIQKRKFTFYPSITNKWEVKEIENRKITYQDGLATGSDTFYQKDVDQALATQTTLPIWTDNPWAVELRQTNQGCEKGNCQDGFGKMNYENGVYEGFFKNGKRNGMGNYKWNDDSLYIGHWENDMMSGYGFYSVLNNPNFKHYFGYFKDGKFDGKGSSDKGDAFERGIYKNGSLVSPLNFYSNKIEKGCNAGDCQNSFGRFIFDNGDIFTGFFTNGVQASGIYRFKAGGHYSGEFNSSGQFHGQGFFVDTNKNMYYGQWQNGSLNGQGLEFNESQQKYNPGIWTNGVLTQKFEY